MKVLVIGQGGREHAIIRGLKMSSSVQEVHAIPGSDGIARDAACHQLDVKPSEELRKFCQQKEFSLVIIGPEAPLVDGLADFFREMDMTVFGPNAVAAQLEGSKIFAKNFMNQADVPTARSFVVAGVEETLKAAESFSPPFVLKASGLAAGKGVLISKDLEELKAHAITMFEDKEFGESGAEALLEEFEAGWELSYLILTDGKNYEALPLAQDHKRLQDGDLGPNTGGMGVVAPMKIASELDQEIREKVIANTLKGLQADSEMDYRGVLYIGLMITNQGPKVIEYNVRFGDPEAQVIFPLLDGDWGQALMAVAKGELAKLSWKPLYSSCVVLAAKGYPSAPEKNSAITGDVFSEGPMSYFLHAGTKKDQDQHWVTSGGRVMNAIGIGSNLEESLKNAYSQSEKVSWSGIQIRKDIGQKALTQNT